MDLDKQRMTTPMLCEVKTRNCLAKLDFYDHFVSAIFFWHKKKIPKRKRRSRNSSTVGRNFSDDDGIRRNELIQSIQTDSQTCYKRNRGRETERETERQRDRQRDRQREKYGYNSRNKDSSNHIFVSTKSKNYCSSSKVVFQLTRQIVNLLSQLYRQKLYCSN